MQAGLLITGERSQFEEVFGLELDIEEPPVHLPVPETLKSHVSSITIPAPRRFGSSV